MVKSSYIEFLRYCLAPDLPVPQSAKEIDWVDFLQWAEQQAIIGIVYLGISDERNKADDGKSKLQIPFGTLMEWIGAAQQIKMQNQIALKRFGQLSSLIEGNGFRCCLLKGLGVASYYPNPLLRSCGDLDVWIDGNRKEIINFVRTYDASCEISLHHADMKVFEDQPVEIHFIPGYLTVPYRNRRIQEWFKSLKDEQFKNYRLLKGENEIKVCVPKTFFNLVYLIAHMYRHLIYEGLGLRQVIDYYYVMKEATIEEKSHASMEIVRMGMGKFCSGIMWIMRDVFNVREDGLIMKAVEKEGNYILKRIIDIGNFGMNHYSNGKVSKKWYNLKTQAHYPEELLWSLPHSIYYKLATLGNKF